MAKIKITIQHIENTKDGERYGATTDVYEQSLDWDWVQTQNPYMIQIIIAVINQLTLEIEESK